MRFPPLASVVLATTLGACALPEPERPLVPLLENRPVQPHEEIAHLQARGDPGAPLRYAYDELRWKAGAIGADAVVKSGQRSLANRTPAPYDPPERPLLGNAYPGPLENFEPGAFPPAGEGFKSRGRYYVVDGIAIRYVD